MSITLKKDNTSPILEFTLYDADDVVINLTAATVQFRMWSSSDAVTPVVDSAAVVVGDGTAGQVEYNWAAADTDTVGEYTGAFLVTYADTTIESFPISSYIRITILDNAANWTYGQDPGTSTASERRDSVRLLIGDTDENNQQIFDPEVAFSLSQSNNDIYLAAALLCRTLAAKYAGLTDISVESLKISYSQRRTTYEKLAAKMDRLSKQRGLTGLGIPVGGGTNTDTILDNEGTTDRVKPAFSVQMFEDERS